MSDGGDDDDESEVFLKCWAGRFQQSVPAMSFVCSDDQKHPELPFSKDCGKLQTPDKKRTDEGMRAVQNLYISV